MMAKQDECKVDIIDLGDRRQVHITGPHIDRGVMCEDSLFEITYSQVLLEKILALKGCMYLKDEISRDIDPDYVLAPLKNTIQPVISLEGKTVLDFGSGGGASTINLSRMGATGLHGVDIDGGLVEMATMRAQEYGLADTITFHHVQDTTALPLSTGHFDVIVCSAVLEHIRPADRQTHLAELWRTLKPSGHLFIMGTPNRLWPIDGHTTGLPLVPYMPLNWARGFAVRFSEHVSEDETIDELLVRGIRGCSYWEIKGMLPGSTPVMNTDIERHFAISASFQESFATSALRRTRVRGYKLIDKTVSKMFNLPVGAFYPYISLCFRKEEEYAAGIDIVV